MIWLYINLSLLLRKVRGTVVVMMVIMMMTKTHHHHHHLSLNCEGHLAKSQRAVENREKWRKLVV